MKICNILNKRFDKLFFLFFFRRGVSSKWWRPDHWRVQCVAKWHCAWVHYSEECLSNVWESIRPVFGFGRMAVEFNRKFVFQLSMAGGPSAVPKSGSKERFPLCSDSHYDIVQSDFSVGCGGEYQHVYSHITKQTYAYRHKLLPVQLSCLGSVVADIRPSFRNVHYLVEVRLQYHLDLFTCMVMNECQFLVIQNLE